MHRQRLAIADIAFVNDVTFFMILRGVGKSFRRQVSGTLLIEKAFIFVFGPDSSGFFSWLSSSYLESLPILAISSFS
jgi:hypothetical protein